MMKMSFDKTRYRSLKTILVIFAIGIATGYGVFIWLGNCENFDLERVTSVGKENMIEDSLHIPDRETPDDTFWQELNGKDMFRCIVEDSVNMSMGVFLVGLWILSMLGGGMYGMIYIASLKDEIEELKLDKERSCKKSKGNRCGVYGENRNDEAIKVYGDQRSRDEMIITKMDSNIEEMNKKLGLVEGEKKRLEKNIYSIEIEKGNLVKEKDRVEQMSKMDIIDKENSIRDIETKRKELDRKLSELMKQLHENQEKSGGYQNKIQEMHKEIAQLTSSGKLLQEDNAKLATRYNQMTRTNQDLKNRIQILGDEVSRLCQNIEKLEAHIFDMEQEITQLEQTNQSLTHTNNDLQVKIVYLEQQKKETETKYEKFHSIVKQYYCHIKYAHELPIGDEKVNLMKIHEDIKKYKREKPSNQVKFEFLKDKKCVREEGDYKIYNEMHQVYEGIKNPLICILKYLRNMEDPDNVISILRKSEFIDIFQTLARFHLVSMCVGVYGNFDGENIQEDLDFQTLLTNIFMWEDGPNTCEYEKDMIWLYEKTNIGLSPVFLSTNGVSYWEADGDQFTFKLSKGSFVNYKIEYDETQGVIKSSASTEFMDLFYDTMIVMCFWIQQFNLKCVGYNIDEIYNIGKQIVSL